MHSEWGMHALNNVISLRARVRVCCAYLQHTHKHAPIWGDTRSDDPSALWMIYTGPKIPCFCSLLLLVSYASQASRLPHVESVSYQISKHTLVHTRTICAIFPLRPTSHRGLRQTRSEGDEVYLYELEQRVRVFVVLCVCVYFPCRKSTPFLIYGSFF